MLTEVHRQAADNPIIKMSMLVREGGRLALGAYGESLVVERRGIDSCAVTAADQLLVGLNRTRRSYNKRCANSSRETMLFRNPATSWSVSGIAPETVQHIMLSGDDLATIVSEKGVDAILTVGPLRGRSIAIATAALASRTRAPVLIPVDAAKGIAVRGPEYQKADIPAGFFRGSPPNPRRMLRPFRWRFDWRR